MIQDTKSNLGIIAGGGKLPKEIASIYTKHGGRCFIASIDPENYFNLEDVFPCKPFQLGQVGSLIDYFNQSEVKNIILVGSIQRPELKSIRLDFKGSNLFARIMKNKILGDDNILKTVCKYLEEHDFKVISPLEVLKFTDYDTDLVAVNLPKAVDEKDIEIGKEVLYAIGQLDIGQSVVVCEGYVLGVEAAEGTDNLIRRCEKLRKSKKGGVLVKMSKPIQDIRLDVPTIGPDTIFYLAKHGFNGVAIERKKVIIVDHEETKKLAKKYDIFVSLI